jgi:hypothetical protein
VLTKSIIVVLAMMGQTSRASRDAEGEFGQTPAPAQAQAQAQADPLEAAIARARARGKLKPAGYDRKAQLRRQVAAQERAEAEAQRRYAIEAQRQYERMLPFMMENQRQQLQRMSEIERNQALHRMAAAAESEADTYARRTQALQWYLMQQRAR